MREVHTGVQKIKEHQHCESTLKESEHTAGTNTERNEIKMQLLEWVKLEKKLKLASNFFGSNFFELMMDLLKGMLNEPPKRLHDNPHCS